MSSAPPDALSASTKTPGGSIAKNMQIGTQHTKAISGTVTIPALEYEALIRTKREYAALRGALLSGGVDANTLDILISTDRPPTPASEPSDSTDNLCKPWSPTAQPFVPQSAHTNGFQYRENISRSPSNQYSDSSHPSTPPTPFPDKNDAPDGTHVPVFQQTEQPRYQTNYDDRSLVFRGLSPTTTLLDITNVIRGGSVLNAYLRPKERMAHVSFVESSAAQAFRKYAKRNDIYVKGKRIIVEWDERQTYLPGYLARQIDMNGASRNLVIRFAQPEMTADAIREDVEHIHHLRVVNIRFEQGHAFICTNSILQAITARTCMMSRLKYKTTKIEFYPDECGQFLAPPVPRSYDQKSLPANSVGICYTNRFNLLQSLSEDLHLQEQTFGQVSQSSHKIRDSGMVIDLLE